MPQFVPTEGLFKGRHFDQEIVVLRAITELKAMGELPKRARVRTSK